MKPVKITATLANEMAGAPPQLDAILIKTRCRFHPSAGAHERYDPAPPMETLPPIPIDRVMLNGWWVHRVSSPIIADAASDRHERIAQHFPRELAGHLLPKDQGTIATTNGAQKSMWLPVRKRCIPSVCWFAVLHDSATCSDLRKLLLAVTHVGQDRARGNGRVKSWLVEPVAEDWSWYAQHTDGPVLMRQLPYGDYLPPNLRGFVRDYDAVCPPYWHPSRRAEIVKPC